MARRDRKAGSTETALAGFAKVDIVHFPTGVPGFDEVLGGGLPEYSLSLVTGLPGSGKTTLAHQIAFTNGTNDRPVLYFTLLGEPVIKMLRFQQQFAFFDHTKVGSAVQFVNLSDVIADQGPEAILELIIERVMATNAALIILDSFRDLARRLIRDDAAIEAQNFLQGLGQVLTGCGCTALLLGEYTGADISENPVFAMVDGIIVLSQEAERNSVVRKLTIAKFRGQATIPGMHTMHISGSGLRIYSRSLGLERTIDKPADGKRLSLGVDQLDAMMGGGIKQGDSLLVTGPSGTGKSALATQFIGEGLRNGEPGLIAIFEERPSGYISRAEAFGLKFSKAETDGQLEVLYLRPLDLSVDEAMHEILSGIRRIGAKRLVIDSLVGFEMALAPSFRPDFRESLYRMIGALTAAGVTILSTVEVEDNFTSLQLSHYAVSFLTDDILRLRYVEIDGQMRKAMVVIKMRGGNHSKDIREYVIGDEGIVVVSPRRTDYEQMTTGVPHRTGPRNPQADEVSPEPKSLE